MKNKQDKNFGFFKKMSLLGLIFCTLTAGIWLYFSPEANNKFENTHSLTLIETPRTVQARALNHKAFESFSKQEQIPQNPGLLPTSLIGSSHGSKLNVTEEGDLRINKDVRDFFEFYLAAIDEESLDKILLRINHDMTSQLSGDALQQANELLRNYIDYKISLAELEDIIPPSTGKMNISALKRRNDEIKNLREEHMGVLVAESFFSQDEVYDNYMLSRIEIIQNKALTADERDQALAQVEFMLPEEKRVKRALSTQHIRLSSEVEDLRGGGASDNEVFQFRSEVVGADAAGRLAKLDEKRALWRQRLDEYVMVRDQIKLSGLSDQAQVVAINDLIERRFQGREQLRVRALDIHLKSSAL